MIPIESCIFTAHRFRTLAEEAPDTAFYVLAKHLDLPMDDAESTYFVRQAFKSAYAEIAEATMTSRAKVAKDYAA